MTLQDKRYLVVVADDMGKSASVNRAIAEAHDQGFLTAASVMAGGQAFDDAVKTALERGRLSVGLHVTLCDGKAVLPNACIPDITDLQGNFIKDPFTAGLHYARPGLASQIEAEVAAQFERLERAGLRPCHVDCHHHLHMHPLIFAIVCRQASRRNIRWIRLPKESLSTVISLRSRSRGIMPFVEWAVFGMLGKYNARTARKYGMRSAARVYGLSRTGGVDEQFFVDIINRCGEGLTEIFAHPDTESPAGRLELAALMSARVRDVIEETQSVTVGYNNFEVKQETSITGSREHREALLYK